MPNWQHPDQSLGDPETKSEQNSEEFRSVTKLWRKEQQGAVKARHPRTSVSAGCRSLRPDCAS